MIGWNVLVLVVIGCICLANGKIKLSRFSSRKFGSIEKIAVVSEDEFQISRSLSSYRSIFWTPFFNDTYLPTPSVCILNDTSNMMFYSKLLRHVELRCEHFRNSPLIVCLYGNDTVFFENVKADISAIKNSLYWKEKIMDSSNIQVKSYFFIHQFHLIFFVDCYQRSFGVCDF